MTDAPIIIKDVAGSPDNQVLPFKIEGQDVRGRAVRLGTTADQILAAHDYPEPIGKLLGEALALASLLGSLLKFEGILTLQAKGTGALTLMVVDYRSKGELRGYAQYKKDSLRALGKKPSLKGLVRQGYLAMTIDQGPDMERYQGIVELEGKDLATAARGYFESSEQTPTDVRLAAERDPVTGCWRAGGIMVQHLATGEEGQIRQMARDDEDAWNRATILMGSVKREELLDPLLPLEDLLYRLYHEDGVRVFEGDRVTRGCHCDPERIADMVANFSDDDRDHMTVDGQITVTCEFCNKHFEFAAD